MTERPHRPLRYYELTDATSEDLMAAIEPGPHMMVSQSDILAELDRRWQRDATERMERLTTDVRNMTAHIRLLTISAVLIAAGSFLVAVIALIVAGTATT